MFLVFDVETCTCGGKPSVGRDAVLAIGVSGDDERIFSVWDEGVGDFSLAEREVLKRFKNYLDEVLNKGPVALAGLFIKTYDLPLLAERLFRHRIFGSKADADAYLLSTRGLFTIDLADVYRFLSMSKFGKYSFSTTELLERLRGLCRGGVSDLPECFVRALCISMDVLDELYKKEVSYTGEVVGNECRRRTNDCNDLNAVLRDDAYRALVIEHLKVDLEVLRYLFRPLLNCIGQR